ncbi:hypothetical protein DFH06DRAFT_1147998 [Mycena polygramma]|nr:hypothetical protein DFH06DRAFT_1147998 [Mycena polygramma]
MITRSGHHRNARVFHHYHPYRVSATSDAPIPNPSQFRPFLEGAAATAPTIIPLPKYPRTGPPPLGFLFGSRPVSPPPVPWDQPHGELYVQPNQRSWRYVSAQKCHEADDRHDFPRPPVDQTGNTPFLYVKSQKLAHSSRYFTPANVDHPVIHEGETIYMDGGLLSYWLVEKKLSEHGDYALMSVIQGRHRLVSIIAIPHDKCAVPRFLQPHAGETRQLASAKTLPSLYWVDTWDVRTGKRV